MKDISGFSFICKDLGSHHPCPYSKKKGEQTKLMIFPGFLLENWGYRADFNTQIWRVSWIQEVNADICYLEQGPLEP